MALTLAIAEARYHRAVHKIEMHAHEPNSAQSVVNDLYDITMDLIDGGVQQAVSNDDPLEIVKLSMQVLELMVKIAVRERRLHRRYFGEARA